MEMLKANRNYKNKYVLCVFFPDSAGAYLKNDTYIFLRFIK